MPTVGANNLTLLDWAKRLDPDGKVAAVVEILNETNEILGMMVVIEANGATGHRTTVRSGLPTVAWRKFNAGVQPSKSRTVQVTEASGMLEAFSVVDKALAELNGMTAEFRLSEDRAFLEAMNIEFMTTLIFGDTDVDPEKFTGFAPRFSDKSAENGTNILDALGTGADNSSVWLIVWGANTVHGFFPKGKMSGLMAEDLREDIATDAAGGEYRVLRTHYKWEFGLNVRDWRYVVRIANIDVSDLTKDASGSSADLVDLMIQAIEKVQDLTSGRATFLVTRTIRSFLRRQIKNDTNVRIAMDEVAGRKVVTFDEVPVLRTDALTDTEAQVT